MATLKDVWKKDFGILRDTVVVEDLSSIGQDSECKFNILQFAYPTDTADKYRNDFHAPLYTLSNNQINAAIYLEKKNETTCEWAELAQLNDTTYGYVFGSASDPNYTFNLNKTEWIGYHIDWYLVYNDVNGGAGCYRIRLEYDSLSTGNSEIKYSYTFVLKLWDENQADQTVRFSYLIDGGTIGDKSNDSIILDYETVKWERQLRIDGVFGYADPQEYETEFNRYTSGAQVKIKDMSTERYPCELNGLPYSIHQEIKKTLLLADRIIVDDYNLNNITTYVDKWVIRDSNYEPAYDRWVSYHPVQIQFAQYYQNNNKRRC